MFAYKISLASFACTISKSLAIANEEINGVLIAVVAVGDSVLTMKSCGLNEKIASFSSRRRFA
jgi:hypothetical protein